MFVAANELCRIYYGKFCYITTFGHSCIISVLANVILCFFSEPVIVYDEINNCLTCLCLYLFTYALFFTLLSLCFMFIIKVDIVYRHTLRFSYQYHVVSY